MNINMTPVLRLLFISLLFFISGLIISCEHHCPMPTETYVPPKKDPVIVKDSVVIKDSVRIKDSVVIVKIARRTIEIRQSPDNDQDVGIHEVLSTSNSINSQYCIQANWTRFGASAHYRSLTKFDFSSIYPDEEVKSAILYLTTRPISDSVVEPSPEITRTINNDLQICLISQSWDPKTVTWATQPAFSESVSSTYKISPSITKDVSVRTSFDMTNLVRQVSGSTLKFPNNGFLLKMAYEQLPPYEAFTFYSTNASYDKRPYLQLILESKIEEP